LEKSVKGKNEILKAKSKAIAGQFLLSGRFNLFCMSDSILKIKILTSLDAPSLVRNSE
jgi:hypothetical protein